MPGDGAWRRIEKRNLHLDASLLIVRNTFDMLTSRFEALGDDADRFEFQMILKPARQQTLRTRRACPSGPRRELWGQPTRRPFRPPWRPSRWDRPQPGSVPLR